ncbi:MAG: chloramphenicol acetyltransferase [Rhodobacteraceae bacterium]|nr:MAG: chloramphenicol acetyltransferase [Paracoccaceae bacterium]
MKRWFSKRRYAKNVSIGRYSQVSKDTVIGDHTYIGRHCSIGKTHIGRYVSIANNVSIGNGEHSLQRISTNSVFYEDAYAELTQGDCIIEADAWIAVDAIIRRGVTIGIGAVVGANSFVNSDVPAFAIVVGSPARIIGYRFDEQKRAAILASLWWDQEPDDAKETIDALERAHP